MALSRGLPLFSSPARSAITSRSSLTAAMPMVRCMVLLKSLPSPLAEEPGIVPNGRRVRIGQQSLAGRRIHHLAGPCRRFSVAIDNQFRADVAAPRRVDAPQMPGPFAHSGSGPWRCRRADYRSPAWQPDNCGRQSRRPSTPTPSGCSRTSRAVPPGRRPLAPPENCTANRRRRGNRLRHPAQDGKRRRGPLAVEDIGPRRLFGPHSSPVCFFKAMKLGACEAGTRLCCSSTPLDVLTNNRSATAVVETSRSCCAATRRVVDYVENPHDVGLVTVAVEADHLAAVCDDPESRTLDQRHAANALPRIVQLPALGVFFAGELPAEPPVAVLGEAEQQPLSTSAGYRWTPARAVLVAQKTDRRPPPANRRWSIPAGRPSDVSGRLLSHAPE